MGHSAERFGHSPQVILQAIGKLAENPRFRNNRNSVVSQGSRARIIVADDHSIARNGLRWLLQSDPGILVVGEIPSTAGATALAKLLGRRSPSEGGREADVLLLRVPAIADLALDTLREVAHTIPTIILADSLDSPAVTSALQLGARGVILKKSPAEVLFNSIRSVAAGGYWVDREQVDDAVAAVKKLRAEHHGLPFGLTHRELAIVKAVVCGSTNKEIAEAFSISENTVKRHLSHIFNKLGASNRVELALFASHHRLI